MRVPGCLKQGKVGSVDLEIEGVSVSSEAKEKPATVHVAFAYNEIMLPRVLLLRRKQTHGRMGFCMRRGKATERHARLKIARYHRDRQECRNKALYADLKAGQMEGSKTTYARARNRPNAKRHNQSGVAVGEWRTNAIEEQNIGTHLLTARSTSLPLSNYKHIMSTRAAAARRIADGAKVRADDEPGCGGGVASLASTSGESQTPSVF